MNFLTIMTAFLLSTQSVICCINDTVSRVAVSANEEACQIERCALFIEYLDKLQGVAVAFDKNNQKDTPRLQCEKCKDEKMTWGYINGYLIASSMNAIANQDEFDKMKNIMNEFIAVLAEQDLKKISVCILGVAQDLKIPCVNCNASSWKIPAEK